MLFPHCLNRSLRAASLSALVGIFSLNANLAAAADGPKVQRALPMGCQIGRTTEITLTGTFPSWPIQVWTDASDLTIRPLEASGKLSVTVNENATAGLRHYRIFDANGASSLIPLYVDSCGDLIEAEPNDHHRKAQSVPTLPTAVHGVLEKSGDVDTFKFSLKQGQTLVAALDGQRLGSPMDADLQLLNSTGIILSQQFDHRGLDPELKFVVPSDGDYLVRVLAFPDTPNSTIAYAGGERFVYRLLLTVGPFVQFTVPAGLTTQRDNAIELFGVNLAPSTVVTLPAATDGPQAKSFPGMLGAVSLPVTSGELFFDTELNDGQPTEASAKDSKEKATAPKLSQTITVPCIVTGRISQPGDKDTFTFSSKKDQRWKLRVEAREFGSPLDAVLTIKNADGKQLATNDDTGDNRDPNLSWTAPSDGDFVLMLHDMYRQGSEKHWYRLSIEPEKADFSLATTADLFVGKVNQPLEIPVTVQRTLDLATDIAVGLEPELAGSRFEVVSKKGDDSAKSVKLAIKSSEPYSGPIRIVGRSDNLPLQYARPAKHPSQWLWITITP